MRAWGEGEPDQGLKLWHRLAEVGVTGLLVPEEQGGLDADEVDLVVAFEALGRHAVPGPWVESVALLPRVLADTDKRQLLSPVASGEELATAVLPDVVPLALDADVATAYLLDETVLWRGESGAVRRSVDPARRLFPVRPGEQVTELSPDAAARGFDTAALACAAQVLGAGERLLDEAVGYAKQRKQFGRVIGEFQALKHALADVRVALDFARPLVNVAAMSLRDGSSHASRDVSAAKVATADAAYAAARTSLQVHGAIGYTAEHDLGLWITKVRALVTAWGTPALHRGRVLEAITADAETVGA